MDIIEKNLIRTAESHPDDAVANECMKRLQQRFDPTYMFCADCDGLVVKKAECCLNQVPEVEITVGSPLKEIQNGKPQYFPDDWLNDAYQIFQTLGATFIVDKTDDGYLVCEQNMIVKAKGQDLAKTKKEAIEKYKNYLSKEGINNSK